MGSEYLLRSMPMHASAKNSFFYVPLYTVFCHAIFDYKESVLVLCPSFCCRPVLRLSIHTKYYDTGRGTRTSYRPLRERCH